MNSQGKNTEPEYRIIAIELVNGTVIKGQTNINKYAERNRLSDHVASNEESTITIKDAIVYKKEIENPIKLPTMFVEKRNILWSTPHEEQK